MPLRGPRIHTLWKLSGTARHRRSWLGKLVLQIQEVRTVGFASPLKIEVNGFPEYRWRDASARDLARLELQFGNRINLVKDQHEKRNA